MQQPNTHGTQSLPLIQPLGEQAILVRFGDELSLEDNSRARGFAAEIKAKLASKIFDCTSNLISVLVRYNPQNISFEELRGELMLMASVTDFALHEKPILHQISVRYGGEGIDDVCQHLGCTANQFIQYHSKKQLTALALGFSPGFVYLGLHEPQYMVPRRAKVQENVPGGAILFAAGPTAITSRPIRTGWHIIGHTDFQNFQPEHTPPVTINPGDSVKFNAVENP